MSQLTVLASAETVADLVAATGDTVGLSPVAPVTGLDDEGEVVVVTSDVVACGPLPTEPAVLSLPPVT
jgi:hypothetical protein